MMIYENILDEFLKELSQYDIVIKRAKQNDIIDDDMGMHVVFGMAILPHVINLFECEEENCELIQSTFKFFEKMSNSNDNEVVNLLDVTIIEGLIDEGRVKLERFKKYMGESTLKQCIYMENFFAI